jgi:ESS family glutamate:Na+ symporter
MIVAGISAIEIDKLSGLWVPFILLAVAGGVVTWLYLAFICKKVYKDYYYEGLISMYGMLTGTISSGVLLLREIDPDYKTPASNNLVVGSSYAIVLAAPILVLIGLAAKSTAMCFLTLGLITVYFAALLLFILKAKNKKKSSDATENVSAEVSNEE